MTKDEALKLALEALTHFEKAGLATLKTVDAITAIREALTEQPAQQDSTCNKKLREQGKAYPRTCKKCGFGPCIADRVQPAQQQEPVAWMPIEQMYPQAKAIDILMGDGSILCAVLPQFDGDLWWEGSGTGEKFIDPKYANVTHWRIHDERTSPPASKPWVGLTQDELNMIGNRMLTWNSHSLVDVYTAIEAKLKEKNA